MSTDHAILACRFVNWAGWQRLLLSNTQCIELNTACCGSAGCSHHSQPAQDPNNSFRQVMMSSTLGCVAHDRPSLELRRQPLALLPWVLARRSLKVRPRRGQCNAILLSQISWNPCESTVQGVSCRLRSKPPIAGDNWPSA